MKWLTLFLFTFTGTKTVTFVFNPFRHASSRSIFDRACSRELGNPQKSAGKISAAESPSKNTKKDGIARIAAESRGKSSEKWSDWKESCERANKGTDKAASWLALRIWSLLWSRDTLTNMPTPKAPVNCSSLVFWNRYNNNNAVFIFRRLKNHSHRLWRLRAVSAWQY